MFQEELSENFQEIGKKERDEGHYNNNWRYLEIWRREVKEVRKRRVRRKGKLGKGEKTFKGLVMDDLL